MGHIRLGRLPKTKNWSQVVSLLDNHESDVSDIAKQTLFAAKKAYRNFDSDPGVVYCYWLLTRLTWHARSDSFDKAIEEHLGINLSNQQSSLGVVSKISDHAAQQIKQMGKSTIFTDIAQLSMRQTLSEIIGEKTNTLFGSTSEDIHLAFRSLATKKQFALLSRRYFSTFLNRVIQFFINKEISNHVGGESRFKNIDEVSKFEDALSAYCYQSAKIVEDFAGGWYSKKNWQGDISQEDARKFVHVALRKFRDELALESKN